MASGTYGTSELDYYRRFGTGQLSTDDWVDTHHARAVFNNLNHLHDEALGYVCHWVPLKNSVGSETRITFTDTTTSYITSFFFPMRLDRNGVPHGLVCRMAGRNDTVAQTTSLYCHVQPATENPTVPLTAAGDDGLSEQRSFSTTSDAWDSLTGIHRLIYFKQPQMDALKNLTTKNNSSNNYPVTVQVAMFRADIWGAVTANTGYFSGLMLRQYVGVNSQF